MRLARSLLALVLATAAAGCGALAVDAPLTIVLPLETKGVTSCDTGEFFVKSLADDKDFNANKDKLQSASITGARVKVKEVREGNEAKKLKGNAVFLVDGAELKVVSFEGDVAPGALTKVDLDAAAAQKVADSVLNAPYEVRAKTSSEVTDPGAGAKCNFTFDLELDLNVKVGLI